MILSSALLKSFPNDFKYYSLSIDPSAGDAEGDRADPGGALPAHVRRLLEGHAEIRRRPFLLHVPPTKENAAGF